VIWATKTGAAQENIRLTSTLIKWWNGSSKIELTQTEASQLKTSNCGSLIWDLFLDMDTKLNNNHTHCSSHYLGLF
jgi:hypothetical protein